MRIKIQWTVSFGDRAKTNEDDPHRINCTRWTKNICLPFYDIFELYAMFVAAWRSWICKYHLNLIWIFYHLLRLLCIICLPLIFEATLPISEINNCFIIFNLIPIHVWEKKKKSHKSTKHFAFPSVDEYLKVSRINTILEPDVWKQSNHLVKSKCHCYFHSSRDVRLPCECFFLTVIGKSMWLTHVPKWKKKYNVTCFRVFLRKMCIFYQSCQQTCHKWNFYFVYIVLTYTK